MFQVLGKMKFKWIDFNWAQRRWRSSRVRGRMWSCTRSSRSCVSGGRGRGGCWWQSCRSFYFLLRQQWPPAKPPRGGWPRGRGGASCGFSWRRECGCRNRRFRHSLVLGWSWLRSRGGRKRNGCGEIGGRQLLIMLDSSSYNKI